MPQGRGKLKLFARVQGQSGICIADKNIYKLKHWRGSQGIIGWKTAPNGVLRILMLENRIQREDSPNPLGKYRQRLCLMQYLIEPQPARPLKRTDRRVRGCI